jgi:type VI secretion system secreted protein VgrG
VAVEAGEWIGLRSPFIALGQPGAGAGPALVKIDESRQTVRVETSNATLELKDDTAELVADKIHVGHGLVLPDPMVAVLQVQEAAARENARLAALASDKLFTRYENASNEAAKDLALAAWYAQETLKEQAVAQWDAVKTQQSQCAGPTTFVNGLAVDAAATALTHTGASVTVRPTGVAIESGGNNLTVDATGLKGNGLLIKLG